MILLKNNENTITNKQQNPNTLTESTKSKRGGSQFTVLLLERTLNTIDTRALQLIYSGGWKRTPPPYPVMLS
jgi:hypothetical protein